MKAAEAGDVYKRQTQGAASGITDSISDMGSQQITATISSEEVSITADSVESLSSYPTISGIAPVISTSKTVKKNSNTGNYSVVGVTPSYFTVQDVYKRQEDRQPPVCL